MDSGKRKSQNMLGGWVTIFWAKNTFSKKGELCRTLARWEGTFKLGGLKGDQFYEGKYCHDKKNIPVQMSASGLLTHLSLGCGSGDWERRQELRNLKKNPFWSFFINCYLIIGAIEKVSSEVHNWLAVKQWPWISTSSSALWQWQQSSD